MPDFSFLHDQGQDDGTIRINTSRGGKTRKPSRPIADQLDDVAKGLDGCGKNMAGCGCLLVILGGGALLLLGIL